MPMLGGKTSGFKVPKFQDAAGLTQANPVSGTKYEWHAGELGSGAALGTQTNVRVIGIAVRVDWTVQPTPLECHATVDDAALTFSKANPVSATYYMATPVPASGFTAQSLDAASVLQTYGRAFLLEGRSVKLEFETTGGTVQNLYARVIWAKW